MTALNRAQSTIFCESTNILRVMQSALNGTV